MTETGERIATSLAAERIAKVLARAGVASRREAEKLIAQGRIALDGRTVTQPGTRVMPGQALTLDGKPIKPAEPSALWRYHKPPGLITTHRDPEGRPTVFDALPPALGRVVSIGRLDFNSEGLMLLTNDGALARALELPATGWVRRYRVRVHGHPDAAALAALKQGVTVEGVRYGPIEAAIDSTKGDNAWLTLALTEGRNREVKRVLAPLGLEVNRLIRIAYGPFQLGKLGRGEVERVTGKVMREQLGRLLPGKDGTGPRPDARRRRAA